MDYTFTKLSLSLTGKLPSEDEKKFLYSLPPEKSKVVVIDSLLNKKEFYKFIEFKLLEDYLEGISMSYLFEQAKDYYFLYSTRKTSIFHSQFKDSFESLDYLGKVSLGRLKKDELDIEQISKNILLSPIYEKINMGSFNYVSSVFQHVYNRNPSKYELDESIKLIEGHYGKLFNRTGSSKIDFINIVLNNPEFIENQIRYWYLHLFSETITEQEVINIAYLDFNSSEELLRILALRLWDEN
jgi:hypothetical protein